MLKLEASVSAMIVDLVELAILVDIIASENGFGSGLGAKSCRWS